MLMRKVMAEQPAEDAVLRAEAAVVQKEADAARKVVVEKASAKAAERIEEKFRHLGSEAGINEW